jgi:hypothetical protein
MQCGVPWAFRPIKLMTALVAPVTRMSGLLALGFLDSQSGLGSQA